MTTRTIVVAGGSSGIGLAVAQKAVADGWRTIIVVARNPSNWWMPHFFIVTC